MSDAKSVSIYRFVDYREFLRAEFARKKSRRPTLTISQFANRIGLGSRGFAVNVLKGRKNLSNAKALQVAKGLGLKERATIHFENMVGLARASDDEQREEYLMRLARSSIEAEVKRQCAIVSRDSDYFLFWYMPVIRAMTELFDFKADGVWISERLQCQVAPRECTRALKYLEEARYISRASDGRFRPADRDAFVDDTQTNVALKSFIKVMAVKSTDSLQLPREERGFASMTLKFSKTKMPEARARLKEFVKVFNDTMSEGDFQSEKNVDEEIYHLQMSVFR